MNKVLVCLLSMLLIGAVRAESFMIAGTHKSFQEKGKLLLYNCEKGCEALKKISKFNKIDLKEIRKGLQFSNSIGSDVCSQVYKADSLLGQAQNRDRRAFCRFKDGSMVEMNSLTDHLREQKIAKE